jgi:hypothetical protein
MKLANCLLTFDTGVPVLRRVTVREQFAEDRSTVDVVGTFSYRDEIKWTPARKRAVRAMLRPRRKP